MSEDFPAQLAGFQAGSLLAGYRLEARVGAGGMAVVFRARDQRLGRPVALKILAPALTADAAFRRRFIAESRAAAAVDHPHIIPVYEAGEADGVLFIAMRFVMGGDLRRVLDREEPLAPGRAAEFLSPAASALDAAHRAGLVHRDVKPANILVDASADWPDHVFLSDFGVSKGAVSSVGLTGTGQFLGTPGYSAPEQIRGGAVDGRADQYALACVAYQLLTGEVPFERDQGLAVLYAHLSEPPPSLGSRRPDLPGAADRVLARGLAKVPEERYGSCGDFADALREALGLAPYHRGRASPPDHPPTEIVSSPSEFPGSAGASPAVDAVPSVTETAPAPASPRAGQTDARPDAGPAASEAPPRPTAQPETRTSPQPQPGAQVPPRPEPQPRPPPPAKLGPAVVAAGGALVCALSVPLQLLSDGRDVPYGYGWDNRIVEMRYGSYLSLSGSILCIAAALTLRARSRHLGVGLVFGAALGVVPVFLEHSLISGSGGAYVAASVTTTAAALIAAGGSTVYFARQIRGGNLRAPLAVACCLAAIGFVVAFIPGNLQFSPYYYSYPYCHDFYPNSPFCSPGDWLTLPGLAGSGVHGWFLFAGIVSLVTIALPGVMAGLLPSGTGGRAGSIMGWLAAIGAFLIFRSLLAGLPFVRPAPALWAAWAVWAITLVPGALVLVGNRRQRFVST